MEAQAVMDLNTALILVSMGITIGAVRVSFRTACRAHMDLHAQAILEVRYNLKRLLEKLGERYISNGDLRRAQAEHPLD